MAPPVAVITGAARGIGLEAARRLSATHRMALLDIDGDGVRRAAAEIGRDAAWVACDITDAHAVTAAVDEVVARCGGIDVAISNAGIATAGTLRHLDPDVLAAQLNVNLTGNWRFIHACLPHVIARRGHVLGVASVAARPPSRLGRPGAAGGRRRTGDRGGRRAPRPPSCRDSWRPSWRLRGLVGPLVERAGRSSAVELDAVTAEVVSERGTFRGGLRPDDEGSAAAARSVERARS